MECVTLYALGHGILQLLRIVLSWPPVFLACCLVLSKRFRQGIRLVLGSLAKSIRDGKASAKMGSFEIKVDSHRQRTDTAQASAAAEEALTRREGAEGSSATFSTDAVAHESLPEEIVSLQGQMEYWRNLAINNAIDYIELLLAPKTKALLYFIRESGALPKATFDMWVQAISSGPDELAAIVSVTLQQGLLELNDTVVSPSETLETWVSEREARGNARPPPLTAFMNTPDK